MPAVPQPSTMAAAKVPQQAPTNREPSFDSVGLVDFDEAFLGALVTDEEKRDKEKKDEEGKSEGCETFAQAPNTSLQIAAPGVSNRSLEGKGGKTNAIGMSLNVAPPAVSRHTLEGEGDKTNAEAADTVPVLSRHSSEGTFMAFTPPGSSPEGGYRTVFDENRTPWVRVRLVEGDDMRKVDAKVEDLDCLLLKFLRDICMGNTRIFCVSREKKATKDCFLVLIGSKDQYEQEISYWTGYTVACNLVCAPGENLKVLVNFVDKIVVPQSEDDIMADLTFGN